MHLLTVYFDLALIKGNTGTNDEPYDRNIWYLYFRVNEINQKINNRMNDNHSILIKLWGSHTIQYFHFLLNVFPKFFLSTRKNTNFLHWIEMSQQDNIKRKPQNERKRKRKIHRTKKKKKYWNVPKSKIRFASFHVLVLLIPLFILRFCHQFFSFYIFEYIFVAYMTQSNSIWACV